MEKYALIKIFHHDPQIQVYMYYFMYVYPETIKRRTNYQIPEDMMRTTRKGKLLDQYQNILLGLITFFQKIISLI